MAKILLYIHGLGSNGRSLKVVKLRQELAAENIDLIAPDLPVDASQAMSIIRSLIHELYQKGDLEKLVICGTSLGGFYASYWGELLDAPYVLINPSITPSISLDKYVNNETAIDFETGKPLNITCEMLAVFKLHEDVMNTVSKRLANVYLTKDDDVLPYQGALNKYPNAIVYETGGHRFEAGWDTVVARCKELLNK